MHPNLMIIREQQNCGKAERGFQGKVGNAGTSSIPHVLAPRLMRT